MTDAGIPPPPPGATVESLWALVCELRARVEELEAQLRAAASPPPPDSRTSSAPPSTDGPKSRAERRAEARERRKAAEARGEAGRRPGKQPGAPGTHRAQVADPDVVVVHEPEACDGCGAGLAGADPVGVVRRQVHDVPAPHLVVTEHRAVKRRCRCGRVSTGAFPEGVTAPVQWGPAVAAVGAYLHHAHTVPYERAARVLADCLGADVSPGWLAGVSRRLADRLRPFEVAVKAALRAQPLLHADETAATVAGHSRNNGKKAGIPLGTRAGVVHNTWVQVACTEELTWLAAHEQRGGPGLVGLGVLEGYRGVLVHDAYESYAKQFPEARHAQCAAHILRALARVAEGVERDGPGRDGDPAARAWAREVAVVLRALDRLRRAGGGEDRSVDADAAEALLVRYDAAVADGTARNPPLSPPGTPHRRKRTGAGNLAYRLAATRDQVLAFATDPAIPFTNNVAERDIRVVKLHEKIGGCWRSMANAGAWLRVRSYLATLRKQSQPVLPAIAAALGGRPWLPASPGLAPA